MSSISHISSVEELAEFLARRPTFAELEAFQLSEAALARASELLDKNSDGTLTADESRELDQIVLLSDIVGLIQTQAALAESKDDDPGKTQSSAHL